MEQGSPRGWEEDRLRVHSSTASRMKIYLGLVLVLATSPLSRSEPNKSGGTDKFVEEKFQNFGNDTFGYVKPGQYLFRGHMILGELHKIYKSSLQESRLLIADWGSNYGWFSSMLAFSIPRSHVLSFEGDLMVARSKGSALPFHVEYLKSRKITNNQICVTLFSRKTFQALKALDVIFDVQLVLSVMHWNVMWPEHNGTVESYTENICTWVSASRLTLIEWVPAQHCDKYGTCNRQVGIKIPKLGVVLSRCGFAYDFKRVPRPKLNIDMRLRDKNREQRQLYLVNLKDQKQTDFVSSVASLQQKQVLETIGCSESQGTA